MKKLIITMLCLPTLCFGMTQLRKYVSNLVGRQVNRFMNNRSIQKRSFTFQNSASERVHLEYVHRELSQINAKMGELSTASINIRNKSELREKFLTFIEEKSLCKRILPRVTKFCIDKTNKSLDKLREQTGANRILIQELEERQRELCFSKDMLNYPVLYSPGQHRNNQIAMAKYIDRIESKRCPVQDIC